MISYKSVLGTGAAAALLFAGFGEVAWAAESLGQLAINTATDAKGFGELLRSGAGIAGAAFIVFGVARAVAIVRGRAQEGWSYPVTAVMVGTLMIALPYLAQSTSQTIWKTNNTDILDKVGVGTSTK